MAAKFRFEARLRRPAKQGKDAPWAFLILPKAASDGLPRRGRTTVEGTLNGHPFQATLEPDGKLSHWLRVDSELLAGAAVEIGDLVSLEIAPVKREPEPQVPADLQCAVGGGGGGVMTDHSHRR
nr:DUF1905 domain-containing protein [Pseudomonas carbonaria]